jgi:hypothetical protein
MTAQRRDCVVVTLAAFAIALGVCLWVDNVHLATMNGMWKSLLVDQWKNSPSTARIDQSNYLYFPLEGLFCRILELLGVYAGKTWKQLAIVSVVFGALSTGLVFWFVRRVTDHRGAALAAALLHLGAGFVLELSVTNEDIMPAYFMVLLAMMLAGLWFGEPSVRQVLCVGVVFTIAWLIEWRLMFPCLPALVLALVLSQGPVLRRTILLGVLALSILATTLLVVTILSGREGAVGLPGALWTGKGIATGWAGFSWEKFGLLGVGMGEYLLGGRQIGAPEMIAALIWEWLPALLAELVLLAGFCAIAWRRRHEPRWRAIAIVFLVTLAAGQVLNVYAQPHEPQMQVNVMPWLVVAWGLCLFELLGRAGAVPWALLLAASVAPLPYNMNSFASSRGLDTRMTDEVQTIDRNLDISRTVFFYHGWESVTAWKYLLWTPRWEGVCDLPPAPAAVPKFKWISVVGPAVHHPDWTGEQHAASLAKDLDCAFDKGYDVVASHVWKLTAEQLAGGLMSLKADGRGPALYTLMSGGRYSATPISDLPGYYRIARR